MNTQVSKRALAAGIGVGALALLRQRGASADTPFTSFPFPATAAPTLRTMPDRLAEIRNVKDFGAVGNGVADDTAAIQATFDAAFGPANKPHGNSSWLNRPVYIPAGQYKITSPLVVTNVKGGHIFGDGSLATTLAWAGAYNGNNIPGADNSITPLIITNGFAYSRFEGIGLSMKNNVSACFYLYGNSSCNANTFSDLIMGGAYVGFLIGWRSSSQAISECSYHNVSYSDCPGYGMRVVGQNVLNHWVYGGGASRCGAGISIASGSVPIVSGGSYDGNKVDIDHTYSSPMVISGVRTESQHFISKGGGGVLTAIGCSQDHDKGANYLNFTGSGTVIIDGGISQYGTITGGRNGKIYLRGCAFSNTDYLTGFSGNISQNI